MKQYQYFPFISGLFCACLIITNILDTKFFQLGPFAFPAGIIIFPIVYVFGNIFTEVYGYAQSRKAIWAGLASFVIYIITIEISLHLPPAGFWQHQDAFNTILSQVPRITLASVTAYFVGEFVNSYTIAKLKVKQGGRAMPLRFVASTIVGQFVDTAVFIGVAFIGTLALEDILKIFLSGWLFKVMWEILALPITLPVVRWLKRVENEDYFDTNTNFSPFKITQ